MPTHIDNKSGWQRVLFTAVFWVIFYISQLVIAAVVIAQCLFLLIGGKPNDQLLKFGENMSRYVHDILKFVTFNSEQRPFPFSDFPKSDIIIAPDQSSHP